MQDLIRIGVADTAHETRIGQGALQRMVLGGERGAESIHIRTENVDAAGIDRAQTLFAAQHVQRRPPLRSRFGKRKCAVRKIERRQVLTPCKFDLRRTPVQPPRDHQVKHQPDIAFHSDRDPFTDAPDLANGATLRIGDRWLRRAQQEGVGYPNPFQCLPGNSWLKRPGVSEDIRQFRHSPTIFTR
jgi:hypothetical protein